MQTQKEIKAAMELAGLAPRKQFGQCFLVDRNLMSKIVDTAAVAPDATILEVGPGTGSLTEELIARAGRVVAVEIDRGLSRMLQERFADAKNFTLLEGDIMSGKHALWPDAIASLGGRASLVANLPYNIATPLIIECLSHSWRAARGESSACMFDSLTFIVQSEVAERLAANVGDDQYGQASVIVSLLGKTSIGPTLPAQAFWPAPKIASRLVRIDFDPAAAAKIDDLTKLTALLSLAFGQRRKQIGSLARRDKAGELDEAKLSTALATIGVAATARAEEISPQQFLAIFRSGIFREKLLP